jgi:hypothetical protein
LHYPQNKSYLRPHIAGTVLPSPQAHQISQFQPELGLHYRRNFLDWNPGGLSIFREVRLGAVVLGVCIMLVKPILNPKLSPKLQIPANLFSN